MLTFWYSPIGLVKAVGIVAGIEKPITNNTTTIDTTIATNIPRCQSVIFCIKNSNYNIIITRSSSFNALAFFFGDGL